MWVSFSLRASSFGMGAGQMMPCADARPSFAFVPHCVA